MVLKAPLVLQVLPDKRETKEIKVTRDLSTSPNLTFSAKGSMI
jgi:hypothetical protein